MTYIYKLTIVSLSLLLASCFAESEVNLIESAEDLGFTFSGSEEDIEEFLSEDVLSLMIDLGLEINTGSSPLNLIGTYVASPYCRLSSTNPDASLGCGFSDFFVQFSNQNEESLTIDYQGFQLDEFDNITFFESGSGFISGDLNGDFTIIVRAENPETGNENATAFSGRITSQGIQFYQDIFVPGINSNFELQADLFVDEDNLAEFFE